jgi:hypothetical protein
LNKEASVPGDRAVIGAWDHTGWAVLVTVAGDGTLLDRRRVELVDADLPSMPHHGAGQRLPLPQAVDLVERVRASAERHARLALDTVDEEVPASIRGIAIRELPRLPPTVADRIQSYWAQCRADAVMFRTALAEAAKSRGWSVHPYDARKVLDEVRDILRVDDADTHLMQIRKSIGAPWQKDHRVAMAAAIVACRIPR